ncbi:glycosyltransferase [Halorhabdus amylolytica]|uniref:glycosyltransferase n=1 Tax=Halorhabdus amylolytica TaxID=2559573 RepID=UPI0010AB478E|nr:glycosyltransferase [Halorhabdus amylolytica]
MTLPSVAAFTDTYFPTVNGVTYTIQSWRDCWHQRGGDMPIVYPGSDEYDPDEREYPVKSVPFPFYEGFRVGVPRVPDGVGDPNLVHAHTPFGLGMSAMRLARSRDLPLVASYHTPTSEYAAYVSLGDHVERTIRRTARRYERWFFGRADMVVVPSERTREHVRDRIGIEATVEVVPNGIDTDRFRPVDPEEFLQRYDLPTDRPIVGYTGRHGYEKCLPDIVAATDDMDVTVVFGGDGPARPDVEARAEAADLDVRFLGFLPREELPAFYSALDVFLFSSPVETQGLVALEANACGTPVAGVDSGALAETIEDGVNGYSYPQGDIEAFRDAIRRALDEREELGEHCLERRETISSNHAVDRLEEAYADVLDTESPDTPKRRT